MADEDFNRKLAAILFFIILTLPLSCAPRTTRWGLAQHEYTYQIPEKIDDGWEPSTLETEGANSEKIVELIEDILSENYKNNFKNNPAPVSGKFEKINFRIKVYNECAWSVHDEIIHAEEGDKYKQVITHFLEKHKGQWKIVYMANIRASSWRAAEEVTSTN